MPIFLCITLIFVVWFKYERDKSQRHLEKHQEDFWTREQNANFVRKSDISDLDYIKIPLESLPIMDTNDSKLMEYQQKIQKLARQEIVNLTGYSNTDLKYMYGTANITDLTRFDENYTLLARTLFQWGNYLYQQNYAAEAVTVLEYAISCKTDVSGTYRLLAKIYKAQGSCDKIEELIQSAQSLPSMMKNPILASLKEILNA